MKKKKAGNADCVWLYHVITHECDELSDISFAGIGNDAISFFLCCIMKWSVNIVSLLMYTSVLIILV